MERELTFKNDKLFNLLKAKADALLEGKEQYKRFEEEQQKLHKCGLKVQKYKDKIVPLVQRETEGLVGEFEDITSVNINEKTGEVVIKVLDKVEEFKQNWKEAKTKAYGNNQPAAAEKTGATKP